MLFANAVFVGIDPSAGERPIHYAALDADLHPLALDKSDLESVLAFVAGHERAMVGICSPQGTNRGLMLQAHIRQRFNLLPNLKTWGAWRVCEYELRQHNIRLYNTPSEEHEARGWVRRGFQIYRRLERLGYRSYQTGEELGECVMLEVQPHAAYTALLGRRPFIKGTLEGRLQRQLILYLEGLDVYNPLHSLEEITRHHLLTGHLPLEKLSTSEELEALVGAFTAYLVGTQVERTCQIGVEEEGLITMPVEALKDFYR